MVKIDELCFEKYFSLFISLVEAKSKTSFISFPSNRYTEENEGYKDAIYEKARNVLSFWNWKKNEVGMGKIFQCVVSAIKLDNNENNLVDWRLLSKFENKGKNSQVNMYEEALFDFFYGRMADEESFSIFIKYLGKNYPLIAYLFFIKDKAQYMPISPNNIDTAFNKLGVGDFKTSHQCSWDNYSKYNNLLNQVRELLINKGIKDVSLLNAHSFVWMISGIEEALSKIGISKKDELQKIKQYRELVIKDKEAVIKARVGQGIFRSRLVDYWQKCSVTGCDNLNILIASHIKPWKDCDIKEAIDLYNGLLLIPNLDKLFDLGLISFEDGGKIIISSTLTTKNIKSLAINEKMGLEKIDGNHKSYLAYHRDRVFKK